LAGPESRMARVRLMNSPSAFHQFILNYNSNDGLLPLAHIAAHENCDLGTALLIYWLLEEDVLDRDSHSDDDNWNGLKIVEAIEARVQAGNYAERTIGFDPKVYLNWTPLRVKRLKAQWGDAPPFPAIMLEPSPGLPMKAMTLG